MLPFPRHRHARSAGAPARLAVAVTRTILAGTILAGTILAGVGPARAQEAEAAAQGPIKLGALMPLTGELQAYGTSSLRGVRLAVGQINEAGGVLGRELALAVGDTRTNPQAGIEAAKRLVSIEGAAGLIGALSSGVTIPVATSVARPTGTPQISGASTSPVITGLADGDFLFRTVPTDRLQGEVLARLAREEGLARVGVIHINNDYGEGLAEAFVDSFEQRGGRVIRAVAYAPKQPSYRGELRGTARGAQALVLIGYPQDGITILRQAIEGGFYDRFLASDGLKSQSVIAALGAETLAGMRGTAPLATTDSPAHERFAAAYEARFGDLPADPYIDTAYDATLLLALAIEKAGTATDGAAVRGALREVARPPGVTVGPGEWARARALIAAGEAIDYQGAAGSQDFDAQGDVPGSYGVWEVRGGEIVNLRGIEPQAE